MLLQVMYFESWDGRKAPVMAMVADLTGSESMAAGWLLHLTVSVVLGGVFGCVVGRRWSAGTTVALGALWGIGWWVVGWLVVMPIRLGPLFARLTVNDRVPVLFGGLLCHLLYGAALGSCVAWLTGSVQAGEEQSHE